MPLLFYEISQRLKNEGQKPAQERPARWNDLKFEIRVQAFLCGLPPSHYEKMYTYTCSGSSSTRARPTTESSKQLTALLVEEDSLYYDSPPINSNAILACSLLVPCPGVSGEMLLLLDPFSTNRGRKSRMERKMLEAASVRDI
jgi:hypothetical protein